MSQQPGKGLDQSEIQNVYGVPRKVFDIWVFQRLHVTQSNVTIGSFGGGNSIAAVLTSHLTRFPAVAPSASEEIPR